MLGIILGSVDIAVGKVIFGFQGICVLVGWDGEVREKKIIN